MKSTMQRLRKITPANSVTKIQVVDGDVTIDVRSSCNGDYFEVSQTLLYRQIRPLLLCMRIFGLFFVKIFKAERMQLEPVALYCFFINFLMILNCFRSLSVYRTDDKFDHVLVQRLLFTIWSFECATKGLILTIFCIRKDGFSQFFLEWKRTCGDVALDHICLLLMRKYIVLAIIFVIANSVVFPLILVYIPILEDIYLDVVWTNARTYENQSLVKVILSIMAALNSSASMLPVALFVVLCFSIGTQLKHFTDDMKKSITDNDFHVKIEDFRLRHQNLCSLIHILDHIFAPMVAAIFGANIPMFCLVMFTMVTTLDLHISLLVINLFWLSFILLQLIIVSITAAMINMKAHSPVDHIYTLRFSETSKEMHIQMMLFLNKLTGTQIGITALNLFVIDKPSILTVAGVMLTYFVILVQFKMPSTTECICNINGGALIGNQTFPGTTV